MFGWRRKREGFEWHEYVRTTILLRRANRRRKADAMREAALDGLKDAGRAAAAGLGEAKARAAAGLRDAGEKGVSAGSAGVSSLGAALAGAFAAARVRVVSTLGRAADRLSRRGSAPAEGRAATSPRAAFAAVLESAADGASRLVAPSRAVPIGAVGVLLAVAAGVRAHAASWAPALDTMLLAGAALVLIVVALLLSTAAHRALDGARAAPVPLHQGAAMLGWGGAAAALVLGIGPLLSEGGGSEPRSATAPAVRQPLTTGSLDRGATVQGTATALTGDTMRISGRVVRLSEIEAPELTQTCKRVGGQTWRCGELAKRALAVVTGREQISCRILKDDAEKAALANCRLPSGDDIAAELVRAGHVFADSGFFASYTRQQDEAREAKRGLWGGDYQRPEAFRAARWEAAVKSAPGGCPIKGLVNGRSRTYSMPWEAGYGTSRVRKERGGRWFCSEDEAKAAGWKAGSPGARS